MDDPKCISLRQVGTDSTFIACRHVHATAQCTHLHPHLKYGGMVPVPTGVWVAVGVRKGRECGRESGGHSCTTRRPPHLTTALRTVGRLDHPVWSGAHVFQPSLRNGTPGRAQ